MFYIDCRSLLIVPKSKMFFQSLFKQRSVRISLAFTKIIIIFSLSPINYYQNKSAKDEDKWEYYRRETLEIEKAQPIVPIRNNNKKIRA